MLFKLILFIASINLAFADCGVLNSPHFAKFMPKITSIASDIAIFNSKLKPSTTLYLAYHIHKNALKRKIDPSKVVLLIATESDFNINAYNKAGDYSIAQINFPIWNSEFKRLNRKELDFLRLTNDPAYAINRMVEILEILKQRHPNDRKYYTRYYSNTRYLRELYEKRIKRKQLTLQRR